MHKNIIKYPNLTSFSLLVGWIISKGEFSFWWVPLPIIIVNISAFVWSYIILLQLLKKHSVEDLLSTSNELDEEFVDGWRLIDYCWFIPNVIGFVLVITNAIGYHHLGWVISILPSIVSDLFIHSFVLVEFTYLTQDD